MKILKLENFIYTISIVFLSVLIYMEYGYDKEIYFKEKINDLKEQYSNVLLFNEKIVDNLLYEIIINENLQHIMYEASHEIDKSKNREKLFKQYKQKYKELQNNGILQLHFHLSNGESFLRFHKPEKYGDDLLFRESIRQITYEQKKLSGFEIGRYFDGYRYIYPIFYKEQYVGSVEASIKTTYILNQMKKMMNATYNLILENKFLDGVIVQSHLDKYYHTFSADERYYAGNSFEKQQKTTKSLLENIKKDMKDTMRLQKAFVEFSKDEDQNIQIFTFIPIKNIGDKSIGYFFSIKEDNAIKHLFITQIIKYLIALILFTFLFYFYKLSKNKTKMIEQLNEAIDQTTLVSKTDTKGRITYVNEAFEKLSGYSKEELIGKSHNIVREPSVPRKIFRQMWETIQNKKTWHGTIINRAKDGTNYIVDATVMPILNIDGKIQEYIAIRYDITEMEKYKEILKEQLDDTTKSLEENINYTKQYEEAINNSTAVLKTDTKNIIIYANDQFCKQSGYTLKELIGKNCRELRHENHIIIGDCDSIAQKMQKKQTVSIVFTNIAKDGSYFFSDTVVYPIIDIDGKVSEHLHLMHDISEIINLHQELEDTQKEIIYKMGEIGETRSKETGNHVKRVAEYSKLLALLYGIEEKEAEMLKLASPMHDIGKVGIPDSVLKKPGKLDEIEWEVMRSHAELGYEMLKHSSRPILKAAATVAGEHHEKWDGSGYPKGLKGEDIHIFGRVTALADVFDALGSDRCYKKAWELDKILKLFEEEKGKHFDPKLVELFLGNIDKFLEIRDKFKD